MNEDEKRQFTHMQTDIEQIKQNVTGQGIKVDKMYFALMGSDLANDGGLVGRIKDLEGENKQLREELEKIKTNAIKSDMYLKWIWALVSAFLTGIFMYTLAFVFKK